jgi:serine/threonine protein kinase
VQQFCAEDSACAPQVRLLDDRREDHGAPLVAHVVRLPCRSDFQKIVAKIMALDYTIPDKLQLSDAVKDLLSRIFVKDPEKRITIAQIKEHEWYLHRLPFELCQGYKGFERRAPCCCCRCWRCWRALLWA